MPPLEIVLTYVRSAIQAMDIDATIAQPATDTPLFALGIETSAGNIRQPLR